MSGNVVGIVWNPSKTEREPLERALESVGPDAVPGDVRWFETSADDPGRAATQAALDAGARTVLAVGGDGTVRAVAEHLADSEADAALGIVPLGTGNLLARNLDIPLNDPAAAFTRALTGEGRRIDIGWVEVALAAGTQRYAFAVMAGFGIDAHMITETDHDLKDKAGWLAYVESLGRAVSASEVIGMRLSADGGDAERHDAHTLIVGNCGTLQGGITLLPAADLSDGRLDVLMLNADGIAGWLDTLRNMMWDNGLKRFFGPPQGEGAAESSDSTTHAQIIALTIELDEPRVFEVDGDDIGETTRIDIRIQPGALLVR